MTSTTIMVHSQASTASFGMKACMLCLGWYHQSSMAGDHSNG